MPDQKTVDLLCYGLLKEKEKNIKLLNALSEASAELEHNRVHHPVGYPKSATEIFIKKVMDENV